MITKFFSHPDGLALLLDPELVRKLELRDGMDAAVVVHKDGSFSVIPLKQGDDVDDATFEKALNRVNEKYGPMLKRLEG